jgi:hypothetical protein
VKRGTAGLLGAALFVLGIVYLGFAVDSTLPGWPGVVAIILAFMVFAWSNTLKDD